MFLFTFKVCFHEGFVCFQMAPDYDHLTLMEKVEVFEHAVNNTAGDDLAKLLWLKSPSSEVRYSAFFCLLCRHSGGCLSALVHISVVLGSAIEK